MFEKNANLCYMLQFSVDIALVPEGITHTGHSSLTKACSYGTDKMT